jgi:hypothetical protein
MLHASVGIVLAVRFIGLRRQGCHGRSTLVSHRLKIQLPRLLVWPQEPPILLFWTRIHAGNLCPPRHSSSGVQVDLLPGGATLFFGLVGRNLKFPLFAITGGQGQASTLIGSDLAFRYDIVADNAIVTSQVQSDVFPPQLYPRSYRIPGLLTSSQGSRWCP